MREVQQIQYGVRGIDGKATAAKTKYVAETTAHDLNTKARLLGLEPTAKVLKRHVRTVHHFGSWEEVASA